MSDASTKSESSADKVMREARLFDEYARTPADELVRTETMDEVPSTKITNPRRYGNEGVAGGGFHNEKGPNIQIQEEKPQHQIVAYLKSRGYTNKEIAQATGMTPSWVSQITRQPWFKKRVAEIIKEAGLDPVKQFLAGEALPSLEALSTIRDSDQAPAAARVAAANALLDRVFGKPTQHIESTNTNKTISAAQSEAEKIENELKSIDEQLRSRGQSLPTSPN